MVYQKYIDVKKALVAQFRYESYLSLREPLSCLCRNKTDFCSFFFYFYFFSAKILSNFKEIICSRGVIYVRMTTEVKGHLRIYVLLLQNYYVHADDIYWHNVFFVIGFGPNTNNNRTINLSTNHTTGDNYNQCKNLSWKYTVRMGCVYSIN